MVASSQSIKDPSAGTETGQVNDGRSEMTEAQLQPQG